MLYEQNAGEHSQRLKNEAVMTVLTMSSTHVRPEVETEQIGKLAVMLSGQPRPHPFLRLLGDTCATLRARPAVNSESRHYWAPVSPSFAANSAKQASRSRS